MLSKLNKLSIKDKAKFVKYLGLSEPELSAYAFENIYIWKGLFDIFWAEIENSLCIFFKDKIGCFLYLPPLGGKLSIKSIEEAFRIMDKFNRNSCISRIENVKAKDLAFYRKAGYGYTNKYSDYLCKRIDLVELKGNKFKSQRARFNYFIKHYKFKYLPFSLRYRRDCLKLYAKWMAGRKKRNQDPIYQSMLIDSRACLKLLLEDYLRLDFLGRVVKIDARLCAFTFGFKLNADTFCILYEIADLSFKGLSQFIFREFCSELKDYRDINIMDDSGLENLKRVKLSYHPIKLIPSYIVTRKST